MALSGFIMTASGIVTGYAFLSGQSDHSNIKVEFIPQSPTAAADSAFTDDTGFYSLGIQGGVYTVYFTKQGYAGQYYHEGEMVVLTGNENLDAITLEYANSVNVSGEVSGTWTDDFLYIVFGNAFVPQGKSLTIEPGTVIKFEDYYDFDIYGELTARGTEIEPVIFTSLDENPEPGAWQYIEFHEGASDVSKLEYCIIEYGRMIKTTGCDVTISHCNIRQFSYYAINCHNCSPVIEHNVITAFRECGIILNFCEEVRVRRNEIAWPGPSSHLLGGIFVNTSSGMINGNYIHDLAEQAGDQGAGICFDESPQITCINNIITKCGDGIEIHAAFTRPSWVSVKNNLLYGNFDHGIYQYGLENVPATISGNIIMANDTGISGDTEHSDITVTYNLVMDNTSADYDIDIPGIGQLVANNMNGDPCDPYFNISLDPQFDDPQNSDFHLTEDSPCIDAGDNAMVDFLADKAGNIRVWDGNGDGMASVDIGPYEFGAPVFASVVEPESSLINIYPQPCNDFVMVSLTGNYDQLQFRLLDMNGKVVLEKKTDGGLPDNKFNLNVSSLKRGVYMLNISARGLTKTIKLIKL